MPEQGAHDWWWPQPEKMVAEAEHASGSRKHVLQPIPDRCEMRRLEPVHSLELALEGGLFLRARDLAPISHWR